MSFSVGERFGSGPTLLWLWCRPAATALIQPLAWELPSAAGVALKKIKNKKLTECANGLNARREMCHDDSQVSGLHDYKMVEKFSKRKN